MVIDADMYANDGLHSLIKLFSHQLHQVYPHAIKLYLHTYVPHAYVWTNAAGKWLNDLGYIASLCLTEDY